MPPHSDILDITAALRQRRPRMQTRKGRDLIGGTALVLFGVFFAGYAATQLPLGSFAKMGSGLFPLLAGLAVAAFGLAQVLTLVFRTQKDEAEPDAEPLEKADWLTLLLVVLSIAVFALCVRRFGMVPAIFALVLVASFASEELRPFKALALAAFLSLLGWAVFIAVLGLPIQLFAWPF